MDVLSNTLRGGNATGQAGRSEISVIPPRVQTKSRTGSDRYVMKTRVDFLMKF